MVTLLIPVLALALIAIGLYFWQRPSHKEKKAELGPAPDLRPLFPVTDEPRQRQSSNDAAGLAASSQFSEQLLSRARNGEKSALDEAHKTNNRRLYESVLDELVRLADSEPKLLSLISYVGRTELPVNKSLAKAAVRSWQRSPDRHSTAKALHFAALSDDAAIYSDTVQSVLQFWREGQLPDVSAIELRALFDGEFWVLSAATRSSGAGFLLKRKLSGARRELEAAAHATK